MFEDCHLWDSPLHSSARIFVRRTILWSWCKGQCNSNQYQQRTHPFKVPNKAIEPFLITAESNVAKADRTHPYARREHYDLIDILRFHPPPRAFAATKLATLNEARAFYIELQIRRAILDYASELTVGHSLTKQAFCFRSLLWL